MKTIHFERFLTSSEFEKKLIRSSPNTISAGGWTEIVKKEGLFIDLSKVEFAEFSTLAQIALLIEGAARHKIRVSIALPLLRESKGEEDFINDDLTQEDWATQVKKRIANRRKAFKFMKVSGFIDVIKVAHVPHADTLIEIKYDYDKQDLSIENKDVIEDKFEYLLKKIFPMKWFKPQTENDLLKSQNFATAVLGFEEKIGLSREDAQVLAGTLLIELVENVHNYADDSKSDDVYCQPYALVGAIVLDNGYELRSENYQDYLTEFIEKINSDSSSIENTKHKFIRIVVGDSGLGIPKVLRKYFTSEREDEIPKFENQEASENDKVILWSLNRWSTSDLKKSRIKRGTRGLWRINRLVRSYHGFITLRSDDSLLSIIHDLEISKPVKDNKKHRFLKGTFVDICLIPTLHTKKSAFLSEKKGINPPKFELLYFDADSKSSMPETFQNILIGKLAKSVLNDSKCVILAVDNIPLESSKKTQSFFSNLLIICAELANHGALAVIALNRNWKQIEGAFESATFYWKSRKNLKASYDKAKDDPIIVLDQKGVVKWFGGEDIVQSILSELNKASTNSINLKQIKEIVKTSLEDSSIKKLFRDQPDITEVNKEDIQLRFTSKDILEEVIKNVEKVLNKSILDSDCESVKEGAFRIPTLEQVNRWINVEGLLKEKSLTHLAAFTMACKLKTSESKLYEELLTTAKIDSTSFEFADNFNKSLNENNKLASFSGGLGILENEELITIDSGQKVIVCTDIVMTANTLKHILSKLIRWKTFPTVIVCIFDARGENASDAIECLGKTINLVSLTKINIKLETKNTKNLINIDPILRSPLSLNSNRKIDYPIATEAFLTWCSANDNILYLGHIEGATGKHFLSYVNGEKTIDIESSIRDEIINLFFNNSTQWIDKLNKRTLDNSNSEKIEIWYPSPDKFAILFATALQKRLQNENKNYVLRKIPRAPLGGKWVYPSEVEKVKSTTSIIIVDWGALTAGTIQQLIRLAIEAGANNILALAFLSQMNPDEQLTLTRIQSYEYEEVLPNTTNIQPYLFSLEEDSETTVKIAPETIKKNIPVKIIFFSHLNLRFYLPSECPLCDLQKYFQIDTEKCQLELLRLYAKHRKELLQFRDSENIFANPNVSVYGEQLESNEIVSILNIWQTLNAAIYSTERRFEVSQNLESLSNSDNILDMINWVRALSADPTWLKIHPLRYENLREKIAAIAIYLILHSGTLSDQIIQQSLIVLRVTSIFSYIDNIQQFFRKFLGTHSIIQQVLYDIYSYLNKEIYESETTLIQIYRKLVLCREELIAAKHTLEDRKVSEYSHTLNSLIRNVEFRKKKQLFIESSITDIWTELLNKYKHPMRSHHEVINEMSYVYFKVNELVIPELFPSKQEIEKSIDKWHKCQDFLSNNLFPFLSLLEDLFLGDFYNNVFLPEDSFRLRKIFELKENIDQSTEIINKNLNKILNYLDKDEESLDGEVIYSSIEEVKWWNKFFLEPDSGREPEAQFLRIIKRCPSNLKKCLDTAVEEMKTKYDFISQILFNEEDYEVFCDEELVKTCIAQIIENACKNAELNDSEIFIEWTVEHSVNENILTLSAKNIGSENQAPSNGLGFISLNQKLKEFHGEIKGRKLSDKISDWVFEARLTLLKWQ